MTIIVKKQNTSVLAVFFLGLFIVSFASCKKDEESQPAPQITTVLISGKEYPTTTIGSQVWTITNYDGPGGLLYKSGTEKPEYGRYYTFEEARAVPIPSGWRLPTLQDYMTLAESQGVVFTDHRATGQEAIKKLASTTNWRTIRGTNTSGFNAHPAGYSFQNSAPLDGDISEFWVADGNTFSIQETASGKAHSILFYATNSPDYRFNLRFVKNAQ
jgi:uncharacterized protein (TIGR02145 family)